VAVGSWVPLTKSLRGGAEDLKPVVLLPSPVGCLPTMHFDNEDRHGTTPRLLRRLDDRFYVIEWFGKPAKTYSDLLGEVAIGSLAGRKVAERSDFMLTKRRRSIVS
jgi:hypothetical protein